MLLSIVRKYLPIILCLVVALLFVSLYRSIQLSVLVGSHKEILEESTPEELVPLEVEEENLPFKEEYVSIPYYWETGIRKSEKDYLKGYVPTIKEYMEYISRKETLTLGVRSKSVSFSNQDVVDMVNQQNHIHSKGIENESSFFKWDSDKCEVFDTILESRPIFVCESWIKWGVTPVDSFVLTECLLNGRKGFCIFSDYLQSYYENKSSLDTRCASREDTDLCDLEEYLSLVESN